MNTLAYCNMKLLKVNNLNKIVFILLIAVSLVSCHRKSVPQNTVSGKGIVRTETGLASYYSDKLNGHSTASGEPFNNAKLTAAHKKLPFGTLVKVTNPANGKSVTVRINDRGPFVAGRIIDLSKAAANSIGIVSAGIAKVVIYYRN